MPTSGHHSISKSWKEQGGGENCLPAGHQRKFTSKPDSLLAGRGRCREGARLLHGANGNEHPSQTCQERQQVLDGAGMPKIHASIGQKEASCDRLGRQSSEQGNAGRHPCKIAMRSKNHWQQCQFDLHHWWIHPGWLTERTTKKTSRSAGMKVRMNSNDTSRSSDMKVRMGKKKWQNLCAPGGCATGQCQKFRVPHLLAGL